MMAADISRAAGEARSLASRRRSGPDGRTTYTENDEIVGREIMARIAELERDFPGGSSVAHLGRAVRELRDRVKRTGNAITETQREALEWIVAALPKAGDRVNDWDRTFIGNLADRQRRFGRNMQISEKQLAKMREIYGKITKEG